MPEVDQRIVRLEQNMAKVIFGKSDVIQNCLVALLCGEHILLEDVPGVGKTLTGKTLAKSVSADFARIQFTPDLLPSDIVGSTVFNNTTSEFTFEQGPIFNNIVLADEINRAPPRTQSALLEAMSDKRVSVDGTTHDLPNPFVVIATQNPFEFAGTYALPESQLDRFLLRISVGYPSREHELKVLKSHRTGEPVEELASVVTLDDVRELQTLTRKVQVDDSISEYIYEVAHATRTSDELQVGVSTRGVLLWYRAIQASALLKGRDYAVPDDAKELAVSLLAHRVVAKHYASRIQQNQETIQRIINDVAVPV